MSLAPGSRLGPYEIVAPLGAGGMGEVYRARDTRLGRHVALKVLPTDFARDPDRLPRFEQEARLASSLNHPNILAVYDVGEHDCAPYFVAELLEGQTLRARMAGAGLPLAKALDYAVQIAHGLSAAHDKGIVHRDLKPDNVFITKDGRVKILDFGLARRAAGPDFGEPDGDHATVTAVTRQGVVLGTVGYMAPEQVRGRPADHRSDIFALGVILHEMITGQQPFHRETSIEVLNAILKEEPRDLTAINPDVPPALARMARRCMEKTPDERFQSASDLAFAIDAVRTPSAAVAAVDTTGTRSRRRRRTVGVAVATLAALACLVLGMAAGRFVVGTPPTAIPTFLQLTYESGFSQSARFTRDGATVVFSAAWNGRPPNLYAVRAGGGQPRSFGIDADILGIATNGDMAILLNRRFLDGWLSRGTLARLPVDGGTPRPLLEDVYAGDVSADGQSFAVVLAGNGRQRLEYPVGKVLFDTPGWISHVRIAPDGRSVGFLEHPLDPDDRGYVAVADLAGGFHRLSPVLSSCRGLAWTPDGREIWFGGSRLGEENGLYATTRAGAVRAVLTAPGELDVQDITASGHVLLSSERFQIEIGMKRRDDRAPRDLSWTSTSDVGAVSSDGGRFVVTDYGVRNANDYAVYFRDVDSGAAPVYLGPGYGAGISPDKAFVAAVLLSKPNEMILYPTGAGETRTIPLGNLENRAVNLGGVSWTSDGRRMLFDAQEPGGQVRAYLFDFASRALRAATPAGMSRGTISPDGRLIVAIEDATGRAALVSVDSGSATPLPGIGGGERVVGWTADSRAVFVWDRRLPARVSRLEAATGSRTPWGEVVPVQTIGLMYGRVIMSGDGTAAFYRFRRGLSTVYVADGLK